MTACPRFNHLLVLPRLQVQNANAISSPLTHGFPSMTAFLGLIWALERKARQAGLDLELNSVGVICHSHQELVTEEGFIKSFRLTRNPIDKTGSTAAIVEEGCIHLELSLVLAVQSESWGDKAQQQQDVAQLIGLLNQMRIAGGVVVPPPQPWLRRYQPWVVNQTGSEADMLNEFARSRMRLLPGFALVARDDLLSQRYQAMQAVDPTSSRLDAWLSLSRINWHWQPDEKGSGAWQHDRQGLGWIVPIPVGYGALSELQPAGSVRNARDQSTDFRFVESLFSIGQWVSPHRLKAAEQLLWYADHQPDQGLYRCCNDYQQATHNGYSYQPE
ncbi:type I-F CRISPR-associated protein Csy2 [Nitrincola sp.]|uniref:type I-F CRISPR-associated protein Csy2 n=1 Tax=Nitrincola sp. TaxID=1926584 RepID=UPI003A944B4D